MNKNQFARNGIERIPTELDPQPTSLCISCHHKSDFKTTDHSQNKTTTRPKLLPAEKCSNRGKSSTE